MIALYEWADKVMQREAERLDYVYENSCCIYPVITEGGHDESEQGVKVR